MAQVMLGDPATGTLTANSNGAGVGFARQFTARASGYVTKLWLRTGPTGPAAGNVHAAVYSNTTGPNPLTRLTADIPGNFVANTWIGFAVSPGLAIVAGTLYWVAWLGVGTAIDYTDSTAGAVGGVISDTGAAQATLAATWVDGANNTAASNIYASGTPQQRQNRSNAAVQHASTWMKKKGRIFVPDLWLPNPIGARA